MESLMYELSGPDLQALDVLQLTISPSEPVNMSTTGYLV